jgi:BarA-like signal transduction histidine kinase
MLRRRGLPIISDEELDFMLTGLGVSVEDRPVAKKHILVQAAETGGFTIVGVRPSRYRAANPGISC